MAESFNDAVFWLPSQFLTDGDLLMYKEKAPLERNALKTELKPSLYFPNEFPYEFDSLDSALSSPVESLLGSTETDNTSDEEDFLAGLTRRLTHSSTQKLAVPVTLRQDKLERSWAVAGSPESTLSGIGSWSVSSNGSPNGSSLVSSPPTTPFGGQNDTWDLISAAAGQVARLKMSNSTEAVKYNNNNSHAKTLVAPPKSSSPVHAIRNPNFGLYAGQSLNFDLANTNQYKQYVNDDAVLKTQCGGFVRGRQQVIRPPTWSSQPQQIQNKVRNFGYENARCGRPLGQPAQSAWPPLQVHQQKPQQRPVFLGGSGGVKRECAGTGVFLPRRYGNNAPESRKKSVPAKVVHALNLNFEDMNDYAQHHQRFNSDALIARRNALVTLQKRGLRPEAARNHEIHLPQEWTY
ncbi:TIP41-like protein [Melia azedarach]|uniref:TIP41-like protein n=1 Tax=Melia azedarach TaxID=155640 RepID=A0ACC1YAB8_MELAZ|nr:TIP41-like protein [Melia azedarach]